MSDSDPIFPNLHDPNIADRTVGDLKEVLGLPAIATKLSKVSGKRQETYSGTTNASGQLSGVFVTPFDAPPNIQACIIGGADNQNIRITSITTTGFTALVRNRVDVVGLLPSWTNASNAKVDVVVTEK